MKNLFLILLLLVSFSAQAQNGFFSNPDRDGEGVIITVQGDTLALAFFTFWDETYSIPPEVIVKPPLPITECPNCPIWYVGAGTFDKKFATGKLYTSVALEYPKTLDNSLDEKIYVGDFFIITHRGGWRLEIDCAHWVPTNLYMCNNTFEFTNHLIGE